MFFDSTAGVTAFFPEKVVDNPYIPPVVLTDFQLFGKPAAIGHNSPLNQSIAVTNSLTLSATQNVFSLEFSALSYVDPEQNRYRYRLEGLETEWNETSSAHRLVTYTTLPSGDYVFHVQGSNNRGLWNERGVALRLRILPPWWAPGGSGRSLVLLCFHLSGGFTTYVFRASSGVRSRSAR